MLRNKLIFSQLEPGPVTHGWMRGKPGYGFPPHTGLGTLTTLMTILRIRKAKKINTWILSKMRHVLFVWIKWLHGEVLYTFGLLPTTDRKNCPTMSWGDWKAILWSLYGSPLWLAGRGISRWSRANKPRSGPHIIPKVQFVLLVIAQSRMIVAEGLDWCPFPATKMWKRAYFGYTHRKTFNFLVFLRFSFAFNSGAANCYRPLLTMNYKPDANWLLLRVEIYYAEDVRVGLVNSYLHSTGASAFFVVIYLILFGFNYGSYKTPRELTLGIFGHACYM